ncbi:MAG: hypothetical protein FWC01_00170 [Treponema sp.]|nr:hypothetical protein [Treponema sp.]MCL2236665.1 hypothetical protein [Treponema sp.]
MSDDSTEEAKRPNANYNLSRDRDTAGQEGLTFYYNREHRLAKAPKEVQDLYRETKHSKFGLLGALVADKPRRALFAVIVLLCVVIILLSRIGFFDISHILDDNKIEIARAAHFEDTTIIILKKTARNESAFTGAVDIVVTIPLPAREEYDFSQNHFSHRVYFTREKEEVYRFAVPLNEPELLMVLQNDRDSRVEIKFKPE